MLFQLRYIILGTYKPLILNCAFAWYHLIKLKDTIRNSSVKYIIVSSVRMLLRTVDFITYGLCAKILRRNSELRMGEIVSNYFVFIL